MLMINNLMNLQTNSPELTENLGLVVNVEAAQRIVFRVFEW